MKVAQRLVIMFAFALVACGDDSEAIDAGATDGETDVPAVDGAAPDCMGAADGAACGEERICVGEVCLISRCGDGYVNVTAGEDCEDENEISGDGCEPASCVFSCTSETEESCSDGDPCNGRESCGVTSHRCEAGRPAADTGCILEGGAVGICSSGLCAALGCGNGTREGAEICDDGNDDQDDGCKSDCTYTCEEEIDCSDADFCTGVETCEVATHTCTNAADLECDDEDDCTADSCEPASGCLFTLIDVDEDGYAAQDTCATMDLNGGDCNDLNDAVFPGADELCDGVNNDCDESVDEDIVEVVCRADSDGDGYGDSTAFTSACICPADTIPPRSDGNEDCSDQHPNVYEGSMHTVADPYCSGGACEGNLPFDYNCDGIETQLYPELGASECTFVEVGGVSSCAGGGWTNGTVPGCGSSGTLRSCTFIGGVSCFDSISNNFRQPCN